RQHAQQPPLLVLAQLVGGDRLRTTPTVVSAILLFAPTLHRPLPQPQHVTATLQTRPLGLRLRNALEDGSSLVCPVDSSSAAHKACTFPCSTSSAAVSASALSLRLSSRSSSFTRLRLSPTARGSRGENTAAARSVSTSRHCRRCSSVSPLRRSQTPRSASDMPTASITAASFSCGVHSSGRFVLVFGWSSSFTVAILPAVFNQSDRVGCETPTSFDSA